MCNVEKSTRDSILVKSSFIAGGKIVGNVSQVDVPFGIDGKGALNAIHYGVPEKTKDKADQNLSCGVDIVGQGV